MTDYTTFTNLATTSFKINGNVAQPVMVATVAVDASGGGTAQTASIVTVPADSILLDVTAVATTTFDGDTTTTFEVGVAANTDKYVDPSDFNPASAPSQQSMIGGTNNDQKSPEYISSDTAIIATWTNTASASAGAATVRVTYVPLA